MLKIAIPIACKNSFVFSGSWPATIFDGRTDSCPFIIPTIRRCNQTGLLTIVSSTWNQQLNGNYWLPWENGVITRASSLIYKLASIIWTMYIAYSPKKGKLHENFKVQCSWGISEPCIQVLLHIFRLHKLIC